MNDAGHTISTSSHVHEAAPVPAGSAAAPLAGRAPATLALVLLMLLVSGCPGSDPVQEVLQRQARGDFEGSIEPLRRVLADHPDDPRVNFLYGRALTATGQSSLAEWSLRKAAQDPAWEVRAGTQLAVGALQSANFDTAIEIATGILEKEPDNLAVLLLRAKANARSRRFYEEALLDADRIEELDPGNAEAMEPRIVSLLKLDRIDEAAEAIALLGKWIEEKEVNESTRGWHCATEAIFAEESEEEEARVEALWAVCLEKYPGHPNVVGSAIEFYDARRDYLRSLEIMQAAFEAEPQSLDYRKRYALRLVSAGRVDEAEQLLIESTQTAHPRVRPNAWIDLAKHYQDTGNLQAAADATQQAVEASREFGEVPPQLQFEQADALVLAGQLDEALVVTEEMTLAPHREMIRARVAQMRGEYEQALAHYDEAFRLWPDNPWARYYAARAAEAIGDFDSAIDDYRYALRIDVGATDARTRLARIHEAEGAISEATHMVHFFESHVPLDLEGQLLAIRLSAQLQQPKIVNEALARFQKLGPTLLGRAVADAGQGVANRAGAEPAVAYLLEHGADGMAVQDPSDPHALRKLIELAARAGQAEQLGEAVRANLSAHPSESAMHEVLGLWLAAIGAPSEEIQAAHQRALDLDDQNSGALLGLGRVRVQSDPEAALALFDRAAAADPEDPAPKLEAARALVTLERTQEADERFEKLLEQHPLEGGAAAEWAELQLERGAVGKDTEALALRAVRFRGGLPAIDLLARVYRALGDDERAGETEARAQQIRQRLKTPRA
jgi:tetratricopeptide (TPR) repeat protein